MTTETHQQAKTLEGPHVSGEQSTQRRGLTRDRIETGVGVTLVLVIALALWTAITELGFVSKLILPTPLSVLDALNTGLFDSKVFWPSIWITTKAAIFAFLIGCLIGITFGALFAFVPVARRSMYPYVIVGMSFPTIAIAPLFVLWFGYGIAAKVAVGASISFFPILTNTMAGLREINEDEVEFFRSRRATPLQELRILRAPRAVSYLLPSFDLAIIGSLLGVIAGEFISASSGLGFLVKQYSQIGDPQNVFAILICMAVIGLVFKGVMTMIGRLGPKHVSR